MGGQQHITGDLRAHLAIAQDEVGEDGEHRFAPRTLDAPDGHSTQAHTHIMGVARQASTPITGGLVLQLEAEGHQEGEDALEKRLAIAQQVEVGGFVSKVDRDGAVVARRFSCFAHVSRTVKIFELAFPRKVTPRPSPALWLVFCSTLTHTPCQYRRPRLRGEAMDWKQFLAYITGTV